MWNKGDLIIGLYNIDINGYVSCTKINNEFIPLDDISNYKIKLFKNIPQKGIIENIEIMEALNDESKLFTTRTFINMLQDYDEVFINQKILATLISNDRSIFEIKYMEGIYLQNKFIPIYLTPIDNLNTYLIKKSNNEIKSYVKLKYIM